MGASCQIRNLIKTLKTSQMYRAPDFTDTESNVRRHNHSATSRSFKIKLSVNKIPQLV